jgi:AcrR family transcriptional regulator
MTASGNETGRYRQRRRTRAAIVEATTELLRAGTTPSVNDVAEAADVSRRTVYLYFPRIEQLLADATVGLLSQAAIDEAIEAADTGADPAERVAAMIHAVYAAADETLPLGRQLIRLTVDAPEPAGDDDGRAPRRGYRRIGWIERALEPLRPQLDDAGYERLVSALAMVVGWEALIVLRDVRGLSADDQLDTTLWTARALVRAALEDRVNAS